MLHWLPVHDGAETSDQDLVARAKAGDQTAFVALYRRHAPRVARLLRSILGRAADAEDVLQVTFVELHRSLARYDVGRPFTAWLNGIALHATKRFLRARQRRWWQWPASQESLERRADLHAASAEEVAVASDLVNHLYRAMGRLAPGMRLAFALHEIEGLGLTEIAHQLGTSPQAVGAQVERARRYLKRRLQTVLPTQPSGVRP